MHVSLLFKMCNSVCSIKSAFGKNSQDAFKLKLKTLREFPLPVFYRQRNIWLKWYLVVYFDEGSFTISWTYT